MESFLTNEDGSTFAFSGDPGYSNQKFIKVGYNNYATLNEAQKPFNTLMLSM